MSMSYVDVKQTTDLAMRFPMDDIIEKYAEEQGITMKAAKEHEREIKRFLILAALHPQKGYEMKGPIDDLWHVFLTDTMKYQSFCGRVAGRFIHHFPFYPGREHVGEGTYAEFLEDYEKVFKESAPSHIWPSDKANKGEAGALGCAVRCCCKPG